MSRSTSHSTEPYSTPPRHMLTNDSRRSLERPSTQSNNHPYNHGDRAQILEYTHNEELVDTFKWLRKNNNLDPKRDITKYCEFHGHHGHSTPDSIALHFEVVGLFKKGHLQDLLFDKGENTLTKCEACLDNQPTELIREKTVNVITGGFEVSDITYSASRWHVRILLTKLPDDMYA